jgi:hypothetical protein
LCGRPGAAEADPSDATAAKMAPSAARAAASENKKGASRAPLENELRRIPAQTS